MNKNRKQLGEYLKDLRISRGLTQGDIAKVQKCRAQFVCLVETGRSLPPMSYLVKLKKKLDLTAYERNDIAILFTEVLTEKLLKALK